MRKEIILKVILLIVMGIVLFVRPVNVLAVSDDATDLDDYWGDFEDQGSKDDLQEEEEVEEEVTTPSTTTTTTTPTTTTSTTTNTNNTLPDAGIAEDTIMIVAIVALGVAAVYAFKKINEYKNI